MARQIAISENGQIEYGGAVMTDHKADDPQAVWDLVEKIRTAMLATRSIQGLDARPLQSYPDREAHCIFFMTDSQRVLSELEAEPRVLLTFAGKSGNDYVAVTGNARITNDRAKIRELWTAWAQAYWKSPDDPKIRVIAVIPEHARYWDGSNPLVATVAMIKGAITRKQPELGSSGETQM